MGLAKEQGAVAVIIVELVSFLPALFLSVRAHTNVYTCHCVCVCVCACVSMSVCVCVFVCVCET